MPYEYLPSSASGRQPNRPIIHESLEMLPPISTTVSTEARIRPPRNADASCPTRGIIMINTTSAPVASQGITMVNRRRGSASDSSLCRTTNASATPNSMPKQCVSVPKYTRVGSADGLYSTHIPHADSAASSTGTNACTNVEPILCSTAVKSGSTSVAWASSATNHKCRSNCGDVAAK